MCACVCASACVCACVYVCISPRSVCIWKEGVNLLDICFSCSEVIEVSCV